ncbi:uncharacterized protein LOC105202213 isoform X2 [Solenopsis invicta]|uniref:uncharacterized protein LOC105202213 isoform X2 n=1 Tax=Solenopsis invicta TaxID=13686 RepID=UPI00193E9039|nr:uncharacterized protein LOC105202213 isoform X2 [Solenopsis invicta]
MSAKRRRVSSRCRQNARRCKVAECTLDTLPPEIFSIILKMLPLHDVACTVRLVSRRCYDIAATVLNSEFLIAGTRLRIAMKRTEDLKKSVKTGMELLECNKIFNALELIWLQYRMLKAVTWRYTHSSSALVSGCKLVDVLDCLEEGRQVLSFRTSSRTGNPMICMHLKYVLKRAWFTCLRVPNASNEYCWRDKQRYMYLRLRRLVGSYNKHLFHKLHYERKLILRTAPPAWTYSGYGEYGGQFFYYGNMSKYAYENRFRHARVRSAENTGRELEEATNRPPCFDVIIGVQLRCSPELAPLTAKMNLKTDTFEGCDTNSPQELYLKLNIKCAISKINRLPNTFTWEVHGRRKNRRKSLQCR